MPAPKQRELPIKRRAPNFKDKVRLHLQMPRKQIEMLEELQDVLGLGSNQDVCYYLLTLALSEREKIAELRKARESTEEIAKLFRGVNMENLEETSRAILELTKGLDNR